MIGVSMTKTINSELQELLDLKNNGAINDEEFTRLKQGVMSQSSPIPQRTGVGWQEILGVFFGILGGIFYVARAKQSGKKKAIVFSMAFVWNLILSGMSAENKPQLTSVAVDPTQVKLIQPQKQSTQPVIPNLVKVGDFEFSNVAIEPYEYSGSADVAGKLFKVSFDAKNISNKSSSPSGFSGVRYGIKDSQGREFEEAALMVGVFDKDIKKKVTDNVLPGSINRVSLIFDVTPDSTGFQLGIFHGFGNKQWLKTS